MRRCADCNLAREVELFDGSRIPDELCKHIVEICERECVPLTLFDMKEAPARAGKQGAEARP